MLSAVNKMLPCSPAKAPSCKEDDAMVNKDGLSLSPSVPGNTSVNSDEWHLSVVEESSLVFGDDSQHSISEGLDDDALPLPSPIRLLDSSIDDSPPKMRASASSARASTSSRSPRPPQVQFSPLSLVPSPMLGQPRLATPPDDLVLTMGGVLAERAGMSPDSSSPTASRSRPPAYVPVRTILKTPRTPGTGRSVRFSLSTLTDHTTSSPSALSAPDQSDPREIGLGLGVDSSGSSSNTEANTTSVDADSSNQFVASFLSRLQAVIPSPDVSHASSVSRLEGPGEESLVEAAEGRPAVEISSPTSSDFGDRAHGARFCGTSALGLGVFKDDANERNLFDESTPFGAGTSISILGASTALPASSDTVARAHSRLLDSHSTTRQSTVHAPSSVVSSLVLLSGRAASSPKGPVQSMDRVRRHATVGPSHLQTCSPQHDDRLDESINDSFQSFRTAPRSPCVSCMAINSPHSAPSTPKRSSQGYREPESCGKPEELHAEDVACLSPIIETSEPDTSAVSTSYVSLRRAISIASDMKTSRPPAFPLNNMEDAGVAAMMDGCTARQAAEHLELVSSTQSCHEAWRANSTTQRALLSSLISNLQEENRRKDCMLAKLRSRTRQYERGWLSSMDLLGVTSDTCSMNQGDSFEMHEGGSDALKEVASRLTAEMEVRKSQARVIDSQAHQSDVDFLRAELATSQATVRDGSIRLQKAQVAEAEATAQHQHSITQIEQLRAENDKLRDERHHIMKQRRDELIKQDRDSRPTVERQLDEAQALIVAQAEQIAQLSSEVSRIERALDQTDGDKEHFQTLALSDLARQKARNDELESRLNDSQAFHLKLERDLGALDAECRSLRQSLSQSQERIDDRESKCARLKQSKASLEQDIFGLNIALEAKQQEASAWKRQVRSLSAATTQSHGVGLTDSDSKVLKVRSINGDTPSSRGLVNLKALKGEGDHASQLRLPPRTPALFDAKENSAPSRRNVLKRLT